MPLLANAAPVWWWSLPSLSPSAVGTTLPVITITGLFDPATGHVTVAEFQAGDTFLILDLENDTWIDQPQFDTEKQAILDALSPPDWGSDRTVGEEPDGWNALIAGLDIANIERISDTRVTISFPLSFSFAYNSTTDEHISGGFATPVMFNTYSDETEVLIPTFTIYLAEEVTPTPEPEISGGGGVGHEIRYRRRRQRLEEATSTRAVSPARIFDTAPAPKPAKAAKLPDLAAIQAARARIDEMAAIAASQQASVANMETLLDSLKSMTNEREITDAMLLLLTTIE